MTRPLILLLLAVMLAACGDNDENTTSTGRVTRVSGDDAKMNGAMEAARTAFGEAWEEIQKDRQEASPAFDTVMVKAYFADANDPDGGEHLWIDDISYDGLTIDGLVASEPLDLAAPVLGDRVSFPLERLSDWLIVRDGVAKGAYTVQALRKRMSAPERAEHDSHYPFSFSKP